MPEEKFDLKYLAKYPFVSQARDYVSSLSLNLAELLEHPVYGGCFDQGKKRLNTALNFKLPAEIPDNSLAQEIDILGFAVARLIANLTNKKDIIGAFAQAEAGRAYGFIEAENEDSTKQLKDDLKLEIKDNLMDYIHYIKLIPRLVREDSKWKLVNKSVSSGKVKIEASEERILLRELIYKKLLDPVPTKGLPPKMVKEAKKISGLAIRRTRIETSGILDKEALPPCIIHILGLLESGSVSHNTMFILGTFLLNLGLTEEQILSVFAGMPTFDPEKTRYQLAFLSGERGGTEYTCPGCASIKSYGLCVTDCVGIKHPLQLYRRNLSEKKFRKKDDTPQK
ncbi:MAG: hypothetical protein ABH950_08875 [Candidatus Altiarchaeota archaeon]